MRFSYVAAGILVIALCLWMASGLIPTNGDDNTDVADSTSEQDTNSPMKVEYIEVSLSAKSRDIVLQGQLEPKRHLHLRAETGSTVEAININKGESVKKGDTIISLSLDGRESDLREAQAQYQTAASQQKAAASLRKKGLQSQVQLEQTQAQLASARAQLNRIKRDIDNTKIIAPFSGVVNGLPIEIGEIVDKGATVAELVDNTGFKVSAQVAQQVLSQLKALSLGDDGALGVKTIDENNQVAFTPIKLISSTLDGAWVTGIPDGSRVITLGQGFVKDGQPVEPVLVEQPAITEQSDNEAS